MLPEPWFRYAGFWNRRIRHVGWRRYCPVCESHLRAFVAHRNDPEMQFDSLCPVCACKCPHRCDWLFIQDYCRRASGRLRLLHVAPEPHLGRRLAALTNVDYVCGDIVAGIGDVRLDICRLPFADASFDLICCCHVLMMLPDDAPAIAEMFRVLRPGGIAVIENPVATGVGTLEPATAEERLELFKDETILRLYGDDYRERLSAAGFVLDEVCPADGIAPAKRERMEIYSGNVILSRKPDPTR